MEEEDKDKTQDVEIIFILLLLKVIIVICAISYIQPETLNQEMICLLVASIIVVVKWRKIYHNIKEWVLNKVDVE